MTPEIAIVEQNTLTALGLEAIIEEFLPSAVVRIFASFEELIDDTPDMYAHYFVSSRIYFAHTSFFLERKPKCIVLSAGEQPLLNGIPSLNICQPQQTLITEIMRLHTHGHGKVHRRPIAEREENRDLSPREIEVLVLLTKGLINKEIAERLNISLTTVISHRKNITEKLGIKSVSALAVYAVMNGYIDADSI